MRVFIAVHTTYTQCIYIHNTCYRILDTFLLSSRLELVPLPLYSLSMWLLKDENCISTISYVFYTDNKRCTLSRSFCVMCAREYISIAGKWWWWKDKSNQPDSLHLFRFRIRCCFCFFSDFIIICDDPNVPFARHKTPSNRIKTEKRNGTHNSRMKTLLLVHQAS